MSYQNVAVSAGRWATILLGFSIPIWVVGDSLLMGVIGIAWLASDRWRARGMIIRENPVAVAALILFGLLVLGMTHGDGTAHDLAKYIDLLFVPVFLTFFDEEKIRQRALRAFCAAAAVSIVVSYLAYMNWLAGNPWLPRTDAYVTAFKSSITHSLIVGFAAFVFALLAREEQNKRRRTLYLILALVAVHNVVFMISSRTGYLVLGILFLYYCVVSFGRRGLVVTAAAAGATFLIAYGASTTFHQRLNIAAQEVMAWRSGTAADTSIGLRLEFYTNGVELVREHPLIGAGTGSFSAAYARSLSDPNMVASTNPHNEYLSISIQIGLLGLASLIYLFYLQWHVAGQLHEVFYRDLARGLFLTFVVGCLFNSLLLDHTEGLLFAWLSGLVFAAPRRSGVQQAA